MSTTPTRKLKLSSVVDPTLDAEIIHMEATELEQVYNDYRAKFGALPSQDVDPTNDQLSGLRQLIMSKALPYVDLSIWGPFGLRTLRKQVFTSYILNASTGEWSKKEAPGPPDVVAWEKSFRTYRVAMLLLQAIDSERIDSYIDHIKELHNRFGSECWGLIYRADVRMRSEHMERVKRELDTAPQYGYSPAAPWSAVFFASTKDAEFWSKEVIIPGTLLLAKGSTGPRKPSAATSDSSDGQRPRRNLGQAGERRESTRETIQSSTRRRRCTHTTGRRSRSARSTTWANAGMAVRRVNARTIVATSATNAWDHIPLRSAQVANAELRKGAMDQAPQQQPLVHPHKAREVRNLQSRPSLPALTRAKGARHRTKVKPKPKLQRSLQQDHRQWC